MFTAVFLACVQPPALLKKKSERALSDFFLGKRVAVHRSRFVASWEFLLSEFSMRIAAKVFYSVSFLTTIPFMQSAVLLSTFIF